MSNQIKVENIAKFEAQAEVMRQKSNDLKNRTTIIGNSVIKTRGYWIGDGGEKHRNAHKKQENGVNAMVEQAKKHAPALEQMALGYQKAISESSQIVQSLSNNIYK